VFVKAKDNGIRCIQAPCPTVTEKALNTSRQANIAGIDWSAGGFDDDQTSKFWNEMSNGPGVIVAGDRYSFTENNVASKGRTATAVYRRLVNAPEPCYVGGCSSQTCSDQPGLISTCIFRPEYACYHDATCERQADGACGWTGAPEPKAWLENPAQFQAAGPATQGSRFGAGAVVASVVTVPLDDEATKELGAGDSYRRRMWSRRT